MVGDGLEREGRHGVAPRLRRRREGLHEVAHRDLERRQLQKRPAGPAHGRRVRRPRAAANPSKQAHGRRRAVAAGDEGFEKGISPLFWLGDETAERGGVRFGALGLRRADWSPMTKDGPKVRDVWASCSNLDPIINLLAEIFVYFPFARYFSVSAKTGLRLIVEDSLMSITKVEGKSPSPSRGRQIDISSLLSLQGSFLFHSCQEKLFFTEEKG